MRCTPMTRKNFCCLTVLVYYRVNSETWLRQSSDAFALLVHGVAIERGGAYAGAPAAMFKIQRQHVSRCNCLSRREAGADGFAAACKTGEVMKPKAAGDDCMIVIFQRAIEFYWRAAFSLAQCDQLRRIERVVIDCLHSLGNERGEQFNFLCGRDRPVNAGGENDCYVGGSYAVLDQAANQDVQNLSARGGPRRVGDD